MDRTIDGCDVSLNFIGEPLGFGVGIDVDGDADGLNESTI